MNTFDCKTCRDLLPDLLLEPELVPAQARGHLLGCAACRTELQELQATMGVLDLWTAPEPTPYFDARVRARLRGAQNEAPEGLWERLLDTVRFSTSWGLRSALAGVFLLILVLGGGTAATLWSGHQTAPAASSPTVNDLRIFDNNAQALQQMDLLDEPGTDSGSTAPQS